MSALPTGLARGIAGPVASSARRARIAWPELRTVLHAAGQLLATAGQQALEENDRPVRRTQPTDR
jgi:hypothetical protein